MSENMVERVARALQNRDSTFEPGEPLDPAFIDDARAAIREMREPTDAMCQAAFDDGWVATTTDVGDFARWWRAMIDTALKD